MLTTLRLSIAKAWQFSNFDQLWQTYSDTKWKKKTKNLPRQVARTPIKQPSAGTPSDGAVPHRGSIFLGLLPDLEDAGPLPAPPAGWLPGALLLRVNGSVRGRVGSLEDFIRRQQQQHAGSGVGAEVSRP